MKILVLAGKKKIVKPLKSNNYNKIELILDLICVMLNHSIIMMVKCRYV